VYINLRFPSRRSWDQRLEPFVRFLSMRNLLAIFEQVLKLFQLANPSGE
jgi:hypothetical protein